MGNGKTIIDESQLTHVEPKVKYVTIDTDAEVIEFEGIRLENPHGYHVVLWRAEGSTDVYIELKTSYGSTGTRLDWFLEDRSLSDPHLLEKIEDEHDSMFWVNGL